MISLLIKIKINSTFCFYILTTLYMYRNFSTRITKRHTEIYFLMHFSVPSKVSVVIIDTYLIYGSRSHNTLFYLRI